MKKIEVPENLLDDTSISDGAKIMYLKVLRLADKAGYCEATNKQLDGSETGRSASRYVQELINAGYLGSNIESNYLRKLFICQK